MRGKLASVILYTEILEIDKAKNPDKQNKIIKQIKNAAKEAVELVIVLENSESEDVI